MLQDPENYPLRSSGLHVLQAKSISSHEPDKALGSRFFIWTAENGSVAPPVLRFPPDLGLHPSDEPRPSPVHRGALGTPDE
jgi:hypothetical protein